MIWKTTALMLSCLLCTALAASAQGLRELRWSEVSGAIPIIAEPNQSLLIVESTLDNLSFASNAGLISVELKERGIWHIRLEPGVQIVTIRAEGFLPLSLPRYSYPPSDARRIRVTAFGAADDFDRDRPELILRYTPGAEDEIVHVQLDGNPPQVMSFAEGSVTLHPTPGQHTVRVFASGSVWEKSIRLNAGEQTEESPVFTGRGGQTLAEVSPGNLFIESSPPGATVFLNQMEQSGKTPLTINNLRPGSYTIEVVSDLYFPSTRSVNIKELDYTEVFVELMPNFGRLQIMSVPAGALVYIDDQQKGTTPLEIPRFNAGQYRLRLVQQLYYEEVDTFSIEPGNGFEHVYTLKPQFGSLTVTSQPPGATVEVDGVLWSATPVTKEQVLSGTHVVRVTKENYYPQENQVEVFDGVHRELPILLSSSVGLLTVESTPSGAVVTVIETGARLGTTPLRDLALDPGTYTLRIELADHEILEKSVPVALAGTPAVKVNLVRKTGHLRIESSPPRAEIILDGMKHGTTPTVIRDLPTGIHTVRLVLDGYDISEIHTDILHNEVTDCNVLLGTAGTEEWKKHRHKARMLSFFPGAGQLITPSQRWRGSLYAVGIMTAAFFAVDAISSFSNAESDYHDANDQYHNSITHHDFDLYYQRILLAYEDMDAARQQFNTSLFVAGGIYAVSILDALIFGGGSRPVASGQVNESIDWIPYAVVEHQDACIGVVFRF